MQKTAGAEGAMVVGQREVWYKRRTEYHMIEKEE